VSVSVSDEESARFWNIDPPSWAQGWRRTIPAAVEAADWIPLDEPVEIKITVWKRSDNAVHDYKIDRP
jgi:hypothetical protein